MIFFSENRVFCQIPALIPINSHFYSEITSIYEIIKDESGVDARFLEIILGLRGVLIPGLVVATKVQDVSSPNTNTNHFTPHQE